MTDVHCHPQKTRSKFLPEMTTTQALNIDQPKSFLSLYNTGTFFFGGGGIKCSQWLLKRKREIHVLGV